MNDTTKLHICPAYPLQIRQIEEPRYEVFSADAMSLRGANLDCAVGVSHLNEGILYLYFSLNGPLMSVSYEPLGGQKTQWSPSSDPELSKSILRDHEQATGERLNDLNALVEKVLGSSVDLLRLKRHPQ